MGSMARMRSLAQSDSGACASDGCKEGMSRVSGITV